MPKKSDIVRLRHMLDAAEKAINFTNGVRRSELDRDEKLALALVRLIEIIGEAAAKVSTELQTRSRAVPSSFTRGDCRLQAVGESRAFLDFDCWQLYNAFDGTQVS